jgi:hypothetical protein
MLSMNVSTPAPHQLSDSTFHLFLFTSKSKKAMGKTSLQTIASLEQQIAAGKKQLQAAFDACGCTDSIGI